MSAVAELEASLQALLATKPPGVTKTRISSITALCTENVKSESVLVQKIWTHFKRTPATHKLGVLYVVDSVVRAWINKAVASGQDIGSGVPALDGTYAAGVKKITDLLPSFMNDLIATAPNDQEEKIVKLVGIWDRGNTFPKPLLADFEKKISAKQSLNSETLSNLPSQLPQSTPSIQAPQISASQGPSPIDILTALQQPAYSLLPPNVTAAQPPLSANVPKYPSVLGGLPAQSAQEPFVPFAQAQQQPQQQHQQFTAPSATDVSSAPASGQDGTAFLQTVFPPSAFTDQAKFNKYVGVLQQLIGMGVNPASWKAVIAALEGETNGKDASQQQTAVDSTARDRRDRSRSPGARNGRGNDIYGRERSPPRRRTPPGQQARLLQHDPTLPPDHIKVLSRTLFVGGTTCPEHELRDVFSRFGNVQSVITNNHKRHAFVKMCTRVESAAAKEGMDNTQDPDVLSKARSVKWGVGFGPRECCDYSQGVSVIPIHRLTDADRRWIVSAEYGGNGGQDIAGGQVMEEPDIEIGAGVSSKAISLKVGASANENNSNRRGGRNKRFQERFQGNAPLQQGLQQQSIASNPNHERVRRRDDEPSIGGAPPAVPGYGFQLPAGLPLLGSAPPQFR